ncbi:hypothetical protein ILYODFUR_031894 [Ilyodon furcidens]|uniref:Uncharacterized protein n=1 Tax=Ilyodon furcidens TaxID=33524 RepID=A0ABV0UA46_9TELE
MIGQKTINSFFSPVSKKRVSKEVNESEEDTKEQKKQKCAVVVPEPKCPPPGPLSPEQLDRIARNKRAALERLASAQTPPGFGESWRKELAAEFVKPYFKQLMHFVCEERKRYTVYPPAEQVFTWTQMCGITDQVPELLTFQAGAESRWNDPLIPFVPTVIPEPNLPFNTPLFSSTSRLCSSVYFGFLHLFFLCIVLIVLPN